MRQCKPEVWDILAGEMASAIPGKCPTRSTTLAGQAQELEMTRLVKINERGRRIGESHPRAVMTDHEVALLLGLLEEREALIEEMTRAHAVQVAIDVALAVRGLSFRLLAVKFDISKGHVAKIARGARRCQTPAVIKAVSL